MIKKTFKIVMGLFAVKSTVEVGYALVKAEYTALNKLGKYAIQKCGFKWGDQVDSFAAAWAGTVTGLTTLSIVAGLCIDTKNPISKDFLEVLELLGLKGTE